MILVFVYGAPASRVFMLSTDGTIERYFVDKSLSVVLPNGSSGQVSSRDGSPRRSPRRPQTRNNQDPEVLVTVVGLPRFELGTSCPPDKRANQAAPQPVLNVPGEPSDDSGDPAEQFHEPPAEIHNQRHHQQLEVPRHRRLLRGVVCVALDLADGPSACGAAAVGVERARRQILRAVLAPRHDET